MKSSTRAVFVAAATTMALSLPGAAQAGTHRHDCFDKMFRDLDRSISRVGKDFDRSMHRLFHWCDRRRK